MLCTHYGPLQCFSTYFRELKEIGVLLPTFPDYVTSCHYGLMKETLNTLEKLRERLQQNLPQEQGLLLLKNENKKVANRKRQEGQSITLKSTQDNNKHIKLTTIPNRKRKKYFHKSCWHKKRKANKRFTNRHIQKFNERRRH